jgi:hypothetical protein
MIIMCTDICMYTYMYVYVSVYMFICAYMYYHSLTIMNTSISTHLILTSTFHTYRHDNVYTCICIHMHMHTYIYIYMYYDSLTIMKAWISAERFPFLLKYLLNLFIVKTKDWYMNTYNYICIYTFMFMCIYSYII